MTRSTAADLAVFESHRGLLVAHAYRMLGDLARAEDMVQEAWLRWDGRQGEADSPRAYLVTLVTRLCLNELDSATTRREEAEAIACPSRSISTKAALAEWRCSTRSRWRSWCCFSV
jgi:RNA polymerase sigma-70 factor (ECF subfamily)